MSRAEEIRGGKKRNMVAWGVSDIIEDVIELEHRIYLRNKEK